MQDRTLVRISIAFAFLGLAALFVLARTLELPERSLLELKAGEDARVVATIVSSRIVANGTMTLLAIEQQVRRTALVRAPVNLSAGVRIEASGEVQDYEGEPELVVTRIRTLAAGGTG